MRVLLASTRGAGHFGPLAPLAHACRRAGHEVLVAAPPALRDTVAAAGLPYWEVGEPPGDALEAVWSTVPSLPAEEQNRAVVSEIFGRLNSTAAIPGHRRACREWGPDVVIRETGEYGSALAAELEGIPHARLGIGLASTEEMGIQMVAPVLDELRAEAGLPPDPHAERLRETPYLTWFPDSLEDPDVPPPSRVLRLRDAAWDAGPEPAGEWWPDAEPGAPRVYATFGSVAGSVPDAVPVFGMAMEALAGLPVSCLLTVGREVDLDSLPAAPPNVRLAHWVPQADVLPHAAAVVCHGGAGTTLGALAAGRPLVVVPLFADQPFNAARVAATGAGLAAATEPAAVRAALTRLLADERFGVAAERIATEMRGHGPVSAAIGALDASA